jgi:threonine synthase
MTTVATDVFNVHARLECLTCGRVQPPSSTWGGCVACGDQEPVVVTYDPTLALTDAAEVARTLTPTLPEHVLDLGQGATPLVAAPELAANLHLKVEGQNPTGSHKDRFQAIAVGLARALGYPGVVTSSTGNHGAAAAAFAARAGLRCLVCLHPEAPPALMSQIASYGAAIAIVPGREGELISRLVDGGWYPATSADPALAGRANPYGSEGYKRIAFEIVETLGDVPPVVAVAAASGDTLYGIWRGFQDLHERLGLRVPGLLACQPVGSAPLALALREDGRGVVSEPHSLALSVRDASSGRHASRLVRSHVALPVTVEEDQLADATRALAAHGFCVEPASALALAGLRLARERGVVASEAPAVAILTSSGLNWTRDLDVIVGAPPVHRSIEAALEAADVV